MHTNHSKIKSELIEKVKQLLGNAKQVAIIPHAGPDGDAIGASLATYQYLTKKGLNTQIISPNEYPVFLRWLPQNSEVLTYSQNKKEATRWINQSDTIIMIDHNSYKRAGDLEKVIEAHTGKKMMIDHHPDPDDVVDLIISDTAVSSTCELVYEFIEAMGDDELIDKDIAECIYTGIMTDTGGLSYNSSNPRTYQIVATLLCKGIDKNKIHSNVYDNYSADRMKLLGFCLSEKMEILEEYRTAIISITKKELTQYNYKDGDAEGFVNYPLGIKGLAVSVMFVEKEDLVKISFRSKGKIPVNIIAREHFNGGGHVNAAGGRTNEKIEKAVEKLKKVLPYYKNFLCED